jgi:hypothetical protein
MNAGIEIKDFSKKNTSQIYPIIAIQRFNYSDSSEGVTRLHNNQP